MCNTNDTTGGCCSTTLSIGRPGDRADAMIDGSTTQAAAEPDSARASVVATASDDAAGAEVTTTFGVAGMTCSHCVASVTEEVGGLEGVTGVRVDLVAGGVSTVTVQSAGTLDERAIADAVDEAGYELADHAS